MFPVVAVSAIDFGLVIGQAVDLTNVNTADEPGLNYTGTYSPWFSAELGETASLYLSGKVSTIYENEKWKPKEPPLLPEVGRTEILWRPVPSVYLEAGRLPFRDPAGIIAAGFFDGLGGSVVLGKARLNAHVLYTGLLYKETAKIIMSTHDAAAYSVPFAFDDADSYFSSRRIASSVGAEFSDLTPRTTLTLNALAQFDVNDRDSDALFHSQYLTAHYTAFLLDTLNVTGAVVFGLAENQEAWGNSPHAHFAALAGVDWELPGDVQDMLSGEVRWSSGAADDVAAFTPINSIAQGQVFTPKLSGLTAIKGQYTARLSKVFSASASGTYFIRTDGETLVGADYPASTTRRLMGGELYGNVLWAPVSDVVITLGAGAFFPGMGDVFVKQAPVLWKVTLGLILSVW
ncbi:MAG: hypothetical protein LBT39_03885 [Treponema sp.]|nr:hypothetical protein [Treponema sp.]